MYSQQLQAAQHRPLKEGPGMLLWSTVITSTISVYWTWLCTHYAFSYPCLNAGALAKAYFSNLIGAHSVQYDVSVSLEGRAGHVVTQTNLEVGPLLSKHWACHSSRAQHIQQVCLGEAC